VSFDTEQVFLQFKQTATETHEMLETVYFNEARPLGCTFEEFTGIKDGYEDLDHDPSSGRL
jgi:hypothetical protein